jgi:hypothetical protein
VRRRTKIVATIGPVSRDRPVLERLASGRRSRPRPDRGDALHAALVRGGQQQAVGFVDQAVIGRKIQQGGSVGGHGRQD